jgi:hypothetical protein
MIYLGQLSGDYEISTDNGEMMGRGFFSFAGASKAEQS